MIAWLFSNGQNGSKDHLTIKYVRVFGGLFLPSSPLKSIWADSKQSRFEFTPCFLPPTYLRKKIFNKGKIAIFLNHQVPTNMSNPDSMYIVIVR